MINNNRSMTGVVKGSVEASEPWVVSLGKGKGEIEEDRKKQRRAGRGRAGKGEIVE